MSTFGACPHHASHRLVHIVRRLRSGGVRWFAAALADRLLPARPAMRKQVLAAATGARVLEIGGPSRVFRRGGMLPVYRHAGTVDNINFAGRTAWETDLRDGGEFRFDPARRPGTQRLLEAVALHGVESGAYDLVISSHCLEHVANPLAALREWHRVTRAGGHALLVLPDPSKTFDWRRPVTSLAHLREDYRRGTAEDDRAHFDEILALHDLARDPAAGSADAFRERLNRNAENRCAHHHVFDLDLVSAALTDAGWDVLAAETARPLHLVAWARKTTI